MPCGARHEGKLRAAIETFTDLAIIGSVWRDAALCIGERHLGLTTPAEISQKEDLIAGFGDIIAKSVDLGEVRKIAAAAPDMAPANEDYRQSSRAGRGLRIGIARDAAFGFYYADDLQAFEHSGAALVPIDMINDKALPDIDGLFIGGGFPEIQMAKLAANTGMRRHLRNALGNGLPCYAECGGLMYLCDSLTWNGETHPMVAAISGDVVMHQRPRGRGYVVFTARDTHPWTPAGRSTNAHEFHYASIENLPHDTCFMREPSRGAGIDGRHDAIFQGNTVAGFCHLRNSRDTPWVADFLRFVRSCKTGGPKARAG